MLVNRRLAFTRLVAFAAVLGMTLTAAAPASAAGEGASRAAAPGRCDLPSPGGRVQHVVNVIFDNTHFLRDDPNVASDLEQMPNLLHFITDNGSLISHEHTGLIAHTASGILSSLTGLYGDRMGMPVSNSFGFYDTPRSASFRASFAYWTARLGGANDNTFFMTTPAGKNTPAPWVPFTRSGCSVGTVAAANMVLENTVSDVPSLFGKGSPEDQEVQNALAIPCGSASTPPCTPEQAKAKAQPAADFVGIAIHCGRGDASCGTSQGARPDLLPDEPGGYDGFRALIGAKYADPHLGTGPVTDLDGAPIADGTGNPGFPGFDSMSASVSLGYAAAMQEHGVPVTYSYISDVHDNHDTRRAFGPGEAGYVQALRRYDEAFGRFFARLARDGITRQNTLFTFTADEGDHFVGGPASPAGCDGVTVVCTYQQIGELNANLTGLLGSVPPFSTGTSLPRFSVHSDSAPTVYVDGNPGPTDVATRDMERATRLIEGTNPITTRQDRITNFVAGTAAMRNLHMLTGDARRNPTFTLFANPDYFLCATGGSCPVTGTQVLELPGFAWNHGDFAPEIVTTWYGMVGPGVRHAGVDDRTWSSHADDRSTELALLGLRDDYGHQGRVLVEDLDGPARARGIGDADAYARLAQVYEQLNSPVGQFGRATLVASTRALQSGSPTEDSTFTTVSQRLTELGAERDRLSAEMAEVLDRPVSTQPTGHRDAAAAGGLVFAGIDLLQQAWMLAGE